MDDKPTIVPKGRYRLEYRGSECLNCGHPLQMGDKFCPNCSQANSTKKLTLKDFFDEFFSSLISYDSKLLRTLTALLIRPGKITRDFISGKRASYTNPFRFLLSLAIIYFLMVNYGGNYEKWDKYGSKNEESALTRLSNWNFSLGNDQSPEVQKQLDSIAQNERFKDFLEKGRKHDSLILFDAKTYFNAIEHPSFMQRLNRKQDFFETVIRKDTVYDFEDAKNRYGIPNNLENRWAFNSASGFLRLQKQPGTFLSSLISKLPFAIFFFLPVFALFIWLVYIRKKYTYTDHLIFSFHITSLLFILLIISYLIDSIFGVDSGWVFVTIFATYLFAAMRKFYRQGVFKTTVKYIFLNGIFFILALFAVLTISVGSIFTY
ncbi:MAG: DUF3667 domain-containing protein [Aurantibacter sp.]